MAVRKTPEIKRLQAIVHKTKDAEAKEVFAFLKERAILATPLTNGTIQVHEVPKRSDWIAVMPFLERHKRGVPGWDQTFFYQKDSAVGYFAGGPKTSTRLIVLKAFIDLEDFSKGTTVLHEGWHAFDVMTRPVPYSRRPGSYAFQHGKLWVFEDRITKLFGDPTFSRLIEGERRLALIGGSSSRGFFARCSESYRSEFNTVYRVTRDRDVGFICDSLYRMLRPEIAY